MRAKSVNHKWIVFHGVEIDDCCFSFLLLLFICRSSLCLFLIWIDDYDYYAPPAIFLLWQTFSYIFCLVKVFMSFRKFFVGGLVWKVVTFRKPHNIYRSLGIVYGCGFGLGRSSSWKHQHQWVNQQQVVQSVLGCSHSERVTKARKKGWNWEYWITL